MCPRRVNKDVSWAREVMCAHDNGRCERSGCECLVVRAETPTDVPVGRVESNSVYILASWDSRRHWKGLKGGKGVMGTVVVVDSNSVSCPVSVFVLRDHYRGRQ